MDLVVRREHDGRVVGVADIRPTDGVWPSAPSSRRKPGSAPGEHKSRYGLKALERLLADRLAANALASNLD